MLELDDDADEDEKAKAILGLDGLGGGIGWRALKELKNGCRGCLVGVNAERGRGEA